MATKKTQVAKTDGTVIFFEGVLVSAYKKSQGENGNKVSKNKINVSSDDNSVWERLTKIYENTPKKYIPEWFKNRDDKNMISLKSTYDIPVRIEETGEKFTFDEFCERGLIRGAKVKMKCNIRDYSVYPSAMVIYEDGEEYDAFAGF